MLLCRLSINTNSSSCLQLLPELPLFGFNLILMCAEEEGKERSTSSREGQAEGTGEKWIKEDCEEARWAECAKIIAVIIFTAYCPPPGPGISL